MRLSQAVHLVRRKLTEEFEEEQSSLVESLPGPSWGPSDSARGAVPRQA